MATCDGCTAELIASRLPNFTAFTATSDLGGGLLGMLVAHQQGMLAHRLGNLERTLSPCGPLPIHRSGSGIGSRSGSSGSSGSSGRSGSRIGSCSCSGSVSRIGSCSVSRIKSGRNRSRDGGAFAVSRAPFALQPGHRVFHTKGKVLDRACRRHIDPARPPAPRSAGRATAPATRPRAATSSRGARAGRAPGRPCSRWAESRAACRMTRRASTMPAPSLARRYKRRSDSELLHLHLPLELPLDSPPLWLDLLPFPFPSECD